jgi:hypothetical protein
VEVVGSMLGLGSGSGGGMLEWAVGIGNLAGAEWAEDYSLMFPGSQRYVFGQNLTATVLGDTTSHTLGGANNTLIVAQSVLFGKLLGSVGGLLLGGGRTVLIAGSDSTLNYSGSVLKVTRGESFEYKTEDFWTDLTAMGLAVKALVILTAGCALAGDLCAALNAHTDEHGDKDYPEWATTLATGVSGGFQTLLKFLEKKQAQVKAAAARAADAAAQAAQAAELAAQFAQVNDAAECLLEMAQHNIESTADAAALAAGAEAAALEAGRTDRVLTGDYSLTAKNVSLTSRCDMPGRTSLTVSAEGGGVGGMNGFLYLRGSKQALMQSGPAYVKTSTQGAMGKVNIGNALAGSITLQQGIPNLGPAIVLDGMSQSMKLSVGPPGVGASLELSAATGITLKYGLWSITLGAMGIKAQVAENSIDINPASVMIKGLNLQNEATISMLIKGIQAVAQAAGVLQQKGTLSQVD